MCVRKGQNKNYANIKRFTKLSPLGLKEEFLIRQMKHDKLYPPHNTQYFTVIKNNDSMVTAQKEDYQITLMLLKTLYQC